MEAFNTRDRNLSPPKKKTQTSEAINPCDYSLFAFSPQTPHTTKVFLPKK